MGRFFCGKGTLRALHERAEVISEKAPSFERGRGIRNLLLRESIYEIKCFDRLCKTTAVWLCGWFSRHIDLPPTDLVGVVEDGFSSLRALLHDGDQTLWSAGCILARLLGRPLGYFVCAGGSSLSTPHQLLGGSFCVRRPSPIGGRSCGRGAPEGAPCWWWVAPDPDGITR